MQNEGINFEMLGEGFRFFTVSVTVRLFNCVGCHGCRFFIVSVTGSIRFFTVSEACIKLMPEGQVEDTMARFEQQLDRRISEIDNDRVRAATLAHPRNVLSCKKRNKNG